jgi:hypothetical protein
MEAEFKNDLKSKVEGLVKMYNFGVFSFQSFHLKIEVILKIPISRNCPLLISNSNFKMYAEFEKGQNMKSVDLEKLSNFYFWRFSTSLENFGVI